MVSTDWIEIDKKVTEHSKQNGCSLQDALRVVAPKAKIVNYYAARSKISKASKKPKASKKRFETFVAQSAALIRITHPSGCVIECPIGVLNDVLSAIKA